MGKILCVLNNLTTDGRTDECECLPLKAELGPTGLVVPTTQAKAGSESLRLSVGLAEHIGQSLETSGSLSTLYTFIHSFIHSGRVAACGRDAG